MNIQTAVLCDAATDSNGKLNLLGAFDSICTNQLPAVHAQCSIALRMTFTNAEEGAHQLRLNFVDEDGKYIMPGLEMQFQVEVPPDVHFATRNFVFTLQQLKFDKPGLYSIDIAYDGRQEAGIPLLVKHTPPNAPSPEQQVND